MRILIILLTAALAGCLGPEHEAKTAELEGAQSETFCPRSHGYWKNHGDWPIDGDFCGTPWAELLSAPPKKGNAYIILAKQWVAAKLNVESGASLGPIEAVFEEATELLQDTYCEAGVIPHGPDRQRALELKDALDKYNNGFFGDEACGNELVMEFVLIPPGTFCMGSPGGGSIGDCVEDGVELGRFANESPYHSVTLTRGFHMQKYEVTQKEWHHVHGGTPTCEDCPMVNVSWWDAIHFANLQSSAAGYAECYDLVNCTGTPGMDFICDDVNVSDIYACEGYRLPTEAEWEYANRAGTQTAYYSGTNTVQFCEFDPNLDLIAWYCGNTTTIMPVGLKAPNAFGLYDMSGSVFEWNHDWFYAAYYHFSPLSDPPGPATGIRRVIRGGSWANNARNARAADRVATEPDQRTVWSGFRLVRTAL